MALCMWQKLQICFAFVPLWSCPYENICPYKSQIQLRKFAFCNSTIHKYLCVFDENEQLHKEFCSGEEEIQQEGYKTIYRGGIDRVSCSANNYQPFAHNSSTGEGCDFVKTNCNQEGQIVYDDGSSTSDRSCRCDYRLGYSFIIEPKQICYCKPAIEDCSCYMKSCDTNQVLTPDYKCVTIEELNGHFYCPDVKGLISKAVRMRYKLNLTVTKADSENQDTFGRIRVFIIGMTIGYALLSMVHGIMDVKGKTRTGCIKNFDGVQIKCNKYETIVLTAVELICYLESTKDCKDIYWTKRHNGNVTKITHATAGVLGSTVTNPSLTLCSPLIEDCGEYVCCAVYNNGTVRSQPIKLNVTGDEPTLSLDDNYYYKMPSEDVAMTCKVRANPPCTRIVWKKIEDGIYTTIQVNKMPFPQSQDINCSLKVDNLTGINSGDYYCFATNEVGTSKSQCVTLYVGTVEEDAISSDEENSTIGTLLNTGRRQRHYSCQSYFESSEPSSKSQRRRRRLS